MFAEHRLALGIVHRVLARPSKAAGFPAGACRGWRQPRRPAAAAGALRTRAGGARAGRAAPAEAGL